uniref:Uncharacterized protein LOC100175702 n=1 Tax=Phallusia mammillata TaxID=59560 RepID=A0A6F9DGJ5_9ASCI|nr:uncharacterized protein LOC100175702 [Phallusia mammillata]
MDQPPLMEVDIDTEENRQLLQAIQQGELSGLADVQSIPFNATVGNLIDAELTSRDGADSGIDVKNETPFVKPQEAPEETGSKSNQNIPQTTSRVSGYKPRSPCFHPDPNYKRWISPQATRQFDPGTQQRIMRMATVSARRRPSSMFSDESLRMPGKLITWHEAMENRPPLRIDMSGPSPTTYSPRNKPLYETNAPAYSFGRKESEKEGSGQKAWSKLWFRSHSPFTHKTNYELRWPTAPHYQQKSMLGPKQACRPGFPSHSIGVRHNLQLVAKGKEEIPASNQYEPELARRHVTRRAPAFSMGCKLPNKIWVKSPNFPAPNMYNPKSSLRSVRPTHPAFTMCVERRFKRHDVGPFATL